MKKLLITSTDMMMIQFLVPHVKYLSENGFHVELACSEVGSRMEDVRKALGDVAKAIHVVRLERSPANPRNLLGYRDMRQLLQKNQYDIIWTNEPVMGVVTRLAARNARKSGTKVVYMCHGFHFFKGANLLNWLVFYPVERVMSRLTDVLITMNEEDFQRAKTFHAGSVHKIPGVGVDGARFLQDADPSIRISKRRELGIPEDAFLLLSVGELTKRKNHEVVLKALGGLDNANIHYVICGVGNLQTYLEGLAKKSGLQDRVHFLGYRTDVAGIMHSADCFIFPSRQEGLPFALMEAMASGLPIICSRIRGNVDLIDEPKGGILCDVDNHLDYSNALQGILRSQNHMFTEHNRKMVLYYSENNVKTLISSILDTV